MYAATGEFTCAKKNSGEPVRVREMFEEDGVTYSCEGAPNPQGCCACEMNGNWLTKCVCKESEKEKSDWGKPHKKEPPFFPRNCKKQQQVVYNATAGKLMCGPR
jgi:hypothetical protein